MRKILTGIAILGLLGLSSWAYAFNCPVEFGEAEAAIAEATCHGCHPVIIKVLSTRF